MLKVNIVNWVQKSNKLFKIFKIVIRNRLKKQSSINYKENNDANSVNKMSINVNNVNWKCRQFIRLNSINLW